MTTIVSESGSLLIYESMNVVWAAQLTNIPVAIQRANLQDLPGGVVTLSEDGFLSIGYFGSDPQMFQVPPLKIKELDYEKNQRELEELEDQIRKSVDITDTALENASIERDCFITVNVNEKLENSIFSSYEINGLNENPKMASLNINLKYNAAFEQVQISIATDFPIFCSESRFTYDNVESNSSEKISCWIYINGNYDPIELKVTVLVSCTNRQSILRVIEKTATLPMNLIWRQANPQKEATLKITMNIENIDELSKIFPEFNYESNSHAIGISSNYTNSIVTIVKAKNTSRFRIQSESVSGLAAILSILIERIKSAKIKVSLNSKDTNQIKTIPTMPIDIVQKLIDEHYAAHKTVKRIKVSLVG